MDLKKVFGGAMKGEIEGRELYTIAAEKSADKKAREVFAFLAREEDSHLEALKAMYRSILKEEEITLPRLKRLVEFKDAVSPIFSPEFKKRLKGKHFEMSALSIAMKLEQDSFQYYKKMAEETDDPALREFFLNLSNWEKDHYNAIYREISFLEDTYFRDNNFAPF
jgi:rubrerythrin